MTDLVDWIVNIITPLVGGRVGIAENLIAAFLFAAPSVAGFFWFLISKRQAGISGRVLFLVILFRCTQFL